MTTDCSSIDPPALAAEVLEQLVELGDPQRRDFAEGNYPTELRVIGIKNAALRIVEKDLLRKLRDSPADPVVELAKAHGGIRSAGSSADRLRDPQPAPGGRLQPRAG